MTLFQLAVMASAAFLFGRLMGTEYRRWGLFGASVVILFWLQPATPLRYADFWLPVLLLLIAVLCWVVARKEAPWKRGEDRLTLAVLFAFIAALGLPRLLHISWQLTASRPPAMTSILAALTITALLVLLLPRLGSARAKNTALTFLLLGTFLTLKTEFLATIAAGLARRLTGQSFNLAAPADLNWIGFSYISFRLLHTLRDSLSGRLPDMSLRDTVTYIFFFPAVLAGPIDRAERFLGDLQRSEVLKPEEVLEGGRRIALGVFKKYILASLLGLISLQPQLLGQVDSALWLWLLVYAYAFQLFLDFSGYTDVAVGMGMLTGIQMPENFNQPYRQVNLTAFWNSWHITLSQWFRAYFFNPVTRSLRRKRSVPAWGIILIGQAGTMILIGLWHGVSWNFLIWGGWHAFGLFVHNRWTAFRRSHNLDFLPKPESAMSRLFGILLTFHFVSMGWLWFALESPQLAWETLLRMVGM